jgi:hypothetical protein
MNVGYYGEKLYKTWCDKEYSKFADGRKQTTDIRRLRQFQTSEIFKK